MNGVDVNQRVSDASADVMQSFQNSNSIARRNAGRMGINPNSGRFAETIKAGALDRATSVAGAKTQARSLAELENYGRLQTAVRG